jgi:peptide/nickel transport system substrate-binding protein
VPQPIVVSNRLRNVPERAVYNFDPGSHFGMYKPDRFWLAAPAGSAAPGG